MLKQSAVVIFIKYLATLKSTEYVFGMFVYTVFLMIPVNFEKLGLLIETTLSPNCFCANLL